MGFTSIPSAFLPQQAPPDQIAALQQPAQPPAQPQLATAGYGSDISNPSAMAINPPAAPGSVGDLESRATQFRQQPQQQPQQQPGTWSENNPFGKIAQDYQTQWQAAQPPADRGGTVKRLLTNFFSGMSDSMMTNAGVPTPYIKRQQLQQNMLNAATLAQGWESAQSENRYRNTLAENSAQQGQFQRELQPGRVVQQQQELAQGQQSIPTVPVIYTAEHIKSLFPMMADDAVQQYAGHPLNAADQAALQQKEALFERVHGLEKLDYNQSGAGPGRGVWWVNTITKQPVSQVTTVSGSAAGLEAQREQFKIEHPPTPKPNYNLMVGTDSSGNQVAGTTEELGAANVKNFVKLGQAEADKVNTARQLTSPSGLFALADRDLAQFKPGELEALAPRWNEFLTGRIGMADPRYVALRTHVNGLLSTALMQAHVGARGGEKLMEHFEDIANAGKMSAPTLKAALNAEREYVEEKAMRPKTGSSNFQSQTQGPPSGATHTAMGSDGNRHYTNVQGQDLGIAP